MSTDREKQIREELGLSLSILESVTGDLESLKDETFWGRETYHLEGAISGVKSGIQEVKELISTLERWIEEDRVEEEEYLREKREGRL
jgi:hypothetical protein